MILLVLPESICKFLAFFPSPLLNSAVLAANLSAADAWMERTVARGARARPPLPSGSLPFAFLLLEVIPPEPSDPDDDTPYCSRSCSSLSIFSSNESSLAYMFSPGDGSSPYPSSFSSNMVLLWNELCRGGTASSSSPPDMRSTAPFGVRGVFVRDEYSSISSSAVWRRGAKLFDAVISFFFERVVPMSFLMLLCNSCVALL
mmetsp:Transcript_112/g.232  ORF Transcript_112/g.232 Transcript_112/m.232 type:complete len:202 (-) Transcript_112:28-633(-)